MKLNIFNKKKKGFTLIEILLAVGFLSIASISIFVVFNAASTSSRARDEMWQMEELSNKIKANYGVVSNYSGITNTVVINNNYAPSKMIDGTSLKNGFGGSITVVANTTTGGTANNSFKITSSNIPGNVCIKLASLASQYFNIVRIDNNVVKDINDLQIDPVTLSTRCNADTVSIDYISL